MNRWGTRAVVAVIVLQVAVPAVALTLEPPTRFGWQMYSGYAGELQVLDTQGQVIDYDLPGIFARHPRPELQWDPPVVRHLCEEVEGADAVSVTQGRDPRRVVPCP